MLRTPLVYVRWSIIALLLCTGVVRAEAEKEAEPGKKADATAAETAKLAGDWGGKWVDVWKYNGQGGDLACTLTAGTGNELTAVFKAPGFMKEAVTVKLKVKADGSTNGSVDMGKPAGTLTFRLQLTADKFSGKYDSLEERGKFEMTKTK